MRLVEFLNSNFKYGTNEDGKQISVEKSCFV